MKTYLFILSCTLLSITPALGQQDAQYTQYVYNTISVNPAYAGSRGALSIAALYRSQWIGLEGAPETITLNAHSPLGIKGVGLGFSVIHDEIGEGVSTETYFDAQFSYTIYTTSTDKLSFGLKAGGHLLNIDFIRLQQFDATSSTFELLQQDNIDNKFSPNVGVGVYYHSDKFYAGISAPNILETDHFDNNTSASDGSTYLASERITYYLLGGYVFDMSHSLKFKPTILFKAVSGAPLQADISANLLFNEKFTLGASYRWDAALSALVGFQLSDQLMIGLAYDREITELGATQFNDGSVEVLMRFELFKSYDNLGSPRFF